MELRQRHVDNVHEQKVAQSSANAKRHLDRTSSTRSSAEPLASHMRHLFLCTLFHRALSVALLLLFGLLQHPFDAASPTPQSTLATLFTRWDSTHYLTLAAPDRHAGDALGESASLNGAQGGYSWEHGIAFQPALPWILNLTGSLHCSVYGGCWNAEVAVAVTSLICAMCSVACPLVLFK